LPLSRRARIEIYLPQKGSSDYARLERAFENEFIDTFGGCTIIKNAEGLYMGADGNLAVDKISLVYADTPFDFAENIEAISEYTDLLRTAALEASEEESILIAVQPIYHSLP
jgi:hypothetical protein